MKPFHQFPRILAAIVTTAILILNHSDLIEAGKLRGAANPSYTMTKLGGLTAFGTYLDSQALGITNPDGAGVVHVAGYSRVAGNGRTMPWHAYEWSVDHTGADLAASDLGTLSPPDDPWAYSTYGKGINNSGVVIGNMDHFGAFVDFPGTGAGTGMYLLPLSGLAGAHPPVAAAVNDPDANGNFAIVGDVVDANRVDHGLVWYVSGPDANGHHNISTPIDLGTFIPNAINDSDVMVGHQTGFPAMATVGDGVLHLGLIAGDTAGSALGINSHGDVVGWTNPNSGATQAIVWSFASSWKPAVLKKLGNKLGGKAYDINEHGQIVGWSFTTWPNTLSSLTAGVLWENGAVYDLNALAGVPAGKHPRVTLATAINDMGQITGITNAKAGVIDDSAVVLTRKP